jgi:hypothetical protein
MKSVEIHDTNERITHITIDDDQVNEIRRQAADGRKIIEIKGEGDSYVFAVTRNTTKIKVRS